MVKRIMKKLKNAESRYSSVVGSVEAEIADKVDFDFNILYQESDGFVMLAFDARNAPIDNLLKIIKEKGKLTKDDYFSNLI